MASELQELQDRLASMEKKLRGHRRWFLAAVALSCVAMAMAWTRVPQSQVVRARSITIEDEVGRDRIVLGAPVPDSKEGQRVSPEVGLVINDADGFERFGLGLMENGNVGMASTLHLELAIRETASESTSLPTPKEART